MNATPVTGLMSFKVVGTDKPESVDEGRTKGACYECGVRWSSLALAHCKGSVGVSGCHQNFSSDTGFTLHRRGGVCTHPQALVKKESGEHYLEWDEVRSWWRSPGDKPEFT